MQIQLDEGYQFGLGLFETIAVEQGRPLLLQSHLERLSASMAFLGIEQTVTKAAVEQYLWEHPADHHGLKIMVSKENCVFTLRPNLYTKQQYDRGFALDYSPVLRNETSPLTYHKSLNYGDCILEKRRTRAMGLDELVFCNSKGALCEGATTNLFFVREGQLFTPPVVCGLLPGVMRRYVLEKFPVREAVLHREDIPQMDECFVTNSLLGIMPVTKLGAHRFPGRQVTVAVGEAWRLDVCRGLV